MCATERTPARGVKIPREEFVEEKGLPLALTAAQKKEAAKKEAVAAVILRKVSRGATRPAAPQALKDPGARDNRSPGAGGDGCGGVHALRRSRAWKVAPPPCAWVPRCKASSKARTFPCRA